MRIEDFGSSHNVNYVDELVECLAKRHSSQDGELVNHFYLYHDKLNPALWISIKGDFAYLHYFPKDRHAGFRSVGNMKDLSMGETTIFYISVEEKIWVLNDAIVPFSIASKVAEEFLLSKDLPKSIDWVEL